MSKRWKRRVPEALAGAALALTLAACGPSMQYAGPGWYLEKPRQTMFWGPQVFKGPFSYEDCETERTKLPDSTAENMLCIRELTPPPRYGPY